ncbi:N-acetylmuramoyl-L-alanine amidase [Streptomyces sp. NBC_01262]|uniref:N-acetylmuramoyl-L-alanine amidase n=1 Tax=Streptomyces sp. NBC_01262 TaxID=2903803 RepID=UPI002E363BDB|nr:peptidoglycan recognition family protein [Streptomyces sp. NBC_01262]
MATPLTADALVAALKAEGATVAEHAGWRTHNRAGHGDWGPVRGVVIHHTAGTDSLNLCYNGRSDLAGPLCHAHIAKTGTITLVGNGRANHAGTFAANAVDAMKAESSTHPRPDAAEPVDANAITYGVEVENKGDGADPYPAVQYDAAVRWAAALCRAHGWSAESVIGHKEGTRRKTDPSFDMTAFRADVAERLTHPASWNPTEDDMPTPKEIAEAVLTTDGIIKNPVDDPKNGFITLATSARNVEIVTRRIDKTMAGLVAQVAALSAALGKLAEAGGLDAAEVQAAAEAGAKAALHELGDALNTTS